MDDWKDLLLSSTGWYAPAAAPVDPDFNPWVHATASQLVQLLKLLDVEQLALARYLNVSTPAVSMWVRGHRNVPAKYRPALLAYAQTALHHALERTVKDLEPLPEGPRLAAIQAFQLRLRQWYLEVCHTGAYLEYQIRDELRAMAPYAAYEYRDNGQLTAEDRHTLRRLGQGMLEKLRRLDEWRAMQDEHSSEASGE
jgi:transcriptional regulator with XRE-family HTH domain